MNCIFLFFSLARSYDPFLVTFRIYSSLEPRENEKNAFLLISYSDKSRLLLPPFLYLLCNLIILIRIGWSRAMRAKSSVPKSTYRKTLRSLWGRFVGMLRKLELETFCVESCSVKRIKKLQLLVKLLC